MSRRTRIRVVVLLVINIILLGRVTYLWATRDVQVRVAPLVEQQIIQRNDLNANTCERAIFLATNPNATPIKSAPTSIDAKQSTLISTAVLKDHYATDITQNALTTAPMLLSTSAFNEERTVWGQFWLPPDENGAYDNSEGFVLYIDATAAVPLLLFTDVRVKDTTHESCLHAVAIDRLAQYRSFAPFIYGTAMMFISFGLVLDYRERVVHFIRNQHQRKFGQGA